MLVVLHGGAPHLNGRISVEPYRWRLLGGDIIAEMAHRGWWRWALLFRRGAMMLWPPTRSGRIPSAGLRSCTTPHGRMSFRFAGGPVTLR